jgi:hypothetical protein
MPFVFLVLTVSQIRIRELESEIAAYENEDTLEENASAEQYRFGSTGETFVKSKGCNEVRCFTSEQGEEMALYIHSLFRPPPPPNGGPATSFEETTEQSLELARLFSERCKRLAAKPRPHALEVRFCVFVPNSDAHPHSAEQARRPGGHDESPAPAQGQGA